MLVCLINCLWYVLHSLLGVLGFVGSNQPGFVWLVGISGAMVIVAVETWH